MPRIKIDREKSYETENAVYVVVEFDYGLKTQLNFAKPITKAELRRQILAAYEQLKPKQERVLDGLADIE